MGYQLPVYVELKNQKDYEIFTNTDLKRWLIELFVATSELLNDIPIVNEQS